MFPAGLAAWKDTHLQTMRAKYISVIDERGKPCAVKGRVIGSDGRGFVDFQPSGTHDDVYIHERFVFGSWLVAYRRARRTRNRIRGFVPGGTNGYVSTRPNGAVMARDERTLSVPTEQAGTAKCRRRRRV